MSKTIKSRSTGKFEDRTCEVCGITGAYPAIKRHQIARHKNDWRVFPSHSADDNTKRIRGLFLPVILNGAISSLVEGVELTPAQKAARTRALKKAASLEAGSKSNPGEGSAQASTEVA